MNPEQWAREAQRCMIKGWLSHLRRFLSFDRTLIEVEIYEEWLGKPSFKRQTFFFFFVCMYSTLHT